MRIATILVAMAFVFALAIPACQVAPAGSELTLRGSEPATLDPALCSDATTASYCMEIFSGLVTLSSDLEVIPDIAESWDISDDLKTYTFHLRDGVRFHNGNEVTASDFKYSLERAADPATHSPVAEAYLGDIVGFRERLNGEADEIAGVVVVGEKTLRITIDAPKSYFLAKLTHPIAFVLDQENVESGADWAKNPNGTGPFKLGEWQWGYRIVLERNDYYYRGVANLERVVFLLTGGTMTMYENGVIDITQVGIYNIERVLDPTNPLHSELLIATELSVSYIGFNTNVPPFDDEKVRQAFCHAIDKDRIIEILLKGLVSPARGILPPGIPGYNEEMEGLSFDVDLARQLIAESSYGDDLPPIVFSVAGSGAAVSSVDLAIAWMWQQNLGVEVEIEVVEWDTFLEDLREGRLQCFEVAWLADYPDPENFLDLLFHSGSVANYSAYSSPQVNSLLEAARMENDIAARLALYQQAEQSIVDDAPCLPLWFGQSYFLIKPHVRGFTPAPMVIPVLKDIWIEN